MEKKKTGTVFGIAAICVVAFVGGYLLLNQATVVTVKGSTTVSPIATACAEAFMDQLDGNEKIDIQISGGGSSTGVTAVGEGMVDIGMSSRDIRESELESYPDLNIITIANDGIAIIVNTNVDVDDLTMEQLKAIYNGSITNWNELGGANQEITVVGRDSASGTRAFFYENVMLSTNFTASMEEANSNGAVKTKVVETPGAIGYVGLGFIDSTVKALNIRESPSAEAVAPTVENVQSGDYSISRAIYLLTIGEPTGAAKLFIDFVLSAEGQEIVADLGFVPIN